MTGTIDTGRKTRPGVVALYLGGVFLFLMAWMIIQPLNASPDELMRYDIVGFLLEHGTLPDGRDPEIRHELWGISYAFNPILSYMLMAVPAKIVSLFTSSPTAILLAARMINVFFGTAMAYLTLRIGEMLFEGRERWMFVCLVTFLPGLIFVHSYINTDSMALFSTAWIVYTWLRSMKEGWSLRICFHLAGAISLCGLSYYNAYGFVLCSILFFVTTILFCRSEKKDFRFLFSRGILISVIVLTLIGWWFIRNAILYDGDILGSRTSSAYAEMYAINELKPSNRMTPKRMGMSIWDMVLYVPGKWNHNWILTVAVSFVGTFGFMDIFMPKAVTTVYFLVCGIGLLGVFFVIRKTFFVRVTKIECSVEKCDDYTIVNKIIYYDKLWNTRNVFHICMMIAMIIPFLLLVSYAYSSDFQAQGRYLLPMIIPFMYFVTYGYSELMNRFIKSEKVKNAVYTGIAVLSIVGALYTYIFVFSPNYI